MVVRTGGVGHGRFSAAALGRARDVTGPGPNSRRKSHQLIQAGEQVRRLGWAECAADTRAVSWVEAGGSRDVGQRARQSQQN